MVHNVKTTTTTTTTTTTAANFLVFQKTAGFTGDGCEFGGFQSRGRPVLQGWNGELETCINAGIQRAGIDKDTRLPSRGGFPRQPQHETGAWAGLGRARSRRPVRPSCLISFQYPRV